MRLRSLFNFSERMVDPATLAQRVSRRYGKKSDYGYYFDKQEVGKHIPIPYDQHTDQAVELMWTNMGDIIKKFGITTDLDALELEKKLIGQYAKTSILPIKSLTPIQPYVSTDNPEILKTKIADVNPNHIKIYKFTNKYYIMDGHHAVMAAAMRGEKTVPVTIIDFNSLVEKYL